MKKIQARHYESSNRKHIDIVVFHTMEAPEMGSTAENVANYFRTTTRKASSHLCFDANSEVRCVDDKDIAYHAPGVNDRSLGYEHAGYARQSPAEWSDPYSEAMLRRSAKQFAHDARKYRIPIKFLNRNQVRGGRGLTTHAVVSEAYRLSDHWDPGPHWPMQHYLNLTNHYFGSTDTLPAPPPPSQILRAGAEGGGVKFLQAMLNILAPFRKPKGGGGFGAQITVDGRFGPQTTEAVKEFQRWVNDILSLQKKHPIAVDGIVGEVTSRNIAFWTPIAWERRNWIRPGDRGNNVKFVQGLLNFVIKLRGPGAQKLVADGIFGPATARAVLEFKMFANGMFKISKSPQRLDGSATMTSEFLSTLSFWSGVVKREKG